MPLSLPLSIQQLIESMLTLDVHTGAQSEFSNWTRHVFRKYSYIERSKILENYCEPTTSIILTS